MANNPWLTSDDFIAAVKRRISFPVYQSTFSNQEILDFANDVVKEEILPNMMQYHQEYFVTKTSVQLESNQSSYPIPNRAVGMKLRDLFYADGNSTPSFPYGNLYEMTNVNSDDKAWYQQSSLSNTAPFRFYLEGNNVVLIPSIQDSPTGLLLYYWFMRPNQLVENSRAFISTGFSKTITVDNAFVVAGNTVTLTIGEDDYVFTAVAGVPAAFQFQIGATSSATATNLASAINLQNLGFSANNGSPATNVIKVTYLDRNYGFASSLSTAFLIQSTIGIESSSNAPSNITSGSYVDLLQTLPGHKTLNFDVIIPINGVSGSTISLDEEDVPSNFIVGDYICTRNECIIPQVPPEIQSSLVQRTCSRILEAVGDKEGMAASDIKVEKLNQTEGNLLADRVDGAPQKVSGRHTLLKSLNVTRRWF